MTRSTKDMQIYYNEEGSIAALYVAGSMEAIGKPCGVESAAFRLLDVQQVLSDAFLLGGRDLRGAALTLDEVKAWRGERDAKIRRATELRMEAARLIEEAQKLESSHE